MASPTPASMQRRLLTSRRVVLSAGRIAGLNRARVVAKVLDLGSLAPPEIDGDLRSMQLDLGGEIDDNGVPRTFNNARQAIDAIETGVVIVDRSHWGRLRLSGKDCVNFMHNQSTNDFKALKPGQGCDTVFVTPTARTLDLATALVGETYVLVLAHPSMRRALADRFNKFIFPADDVKVQDVSERCCMFSLVGPEADAVLKELGGEAITISNSAYGTHQLLAFRGSAPLIVANGSGLAAPGYTLIVDESVAGELWGALVSKGCTMMGEDEWEVARIMAGRPAPGAELTQEHNPLEAGLYHAVSVTKGCYIGQETIAKLNINAGVKQQLVGLRNLPSAVSAGDEVQTTAGERVGVVTSSATAPSGEHVALAYVRCRVGGAQVRLEGLEVQVVAPAAEGSTPQGAPVRGVLSRLPYTSQAFLEESMEEVGPLGPGGDSMQKRAEQARQQREAERQAEAAAKAAKLKAMQDRLAAWQAQQMGGVKQQ